MHYNVVYQDFGLRDYKETWEYQERIFNKLVSDKTNNNKSMTRRENSSPGTLILVEHPHVYTLGKNGSEKNLLISRIQLRAKEAVFYKTDRGGDITYHGPGQIVGYPIFDLEMIGISLKEYVFRLEEAILMTVTSAGLSASRLPGATGVWLEPMVQDRARKICAIGVKASRYVTMHGFAFNVNTDLSYFGYINPCGFTNRGVTSLEKELGIIADFGEIKQQVRNNIQKVFNLNWVN